MAAYPVGIMPTAPNTNLTGTSSTDPKGEGKEVAREKPSKKAKHPTGRASGGETTRTTSESSVANANQTPSSNGEKTKTQQSEKVKRKQERRLFESYQDSNWVYLGYPIAKEASLGDMVKALVRLKDLIKTKGLKVEICAITKDAPESINISLKGTPPGKTSLEARQGNNLHPKAI